MNNALSCWFGLSYASWLTLPRVLMEAMPDDWQGRMAALLREYNAAFPNQPNLGTTVRATATGKLVPMPAWLLDYRWPDHDAIDACRADVRGVRKWDYRSDAPNVVRVVKEEK